MFVVIHAHGAPWDATRSMREQEAWGDHAAFMDELADKGFIVLGGPLGDGSTAFLKLHRSSPGPFSSSALRHPADLATSVCRCGLQNCSPRHTVETGRCRGRRPDLCLEEVAEQGSAIRRVETEGHHDVARVVDGTCDMFADDAGLETGCGEAVERGAPGLVVGYGMFDVQSDHATTVTMLTSNGYPRNLGLVSVVVSTSVDC
jgi:hypothetical protein